MSDRLTESGIFTILIALACGVGFFSQWEAVDRFLSLVFVWLFVGVAAVALARWLIREAWGAAQDWKALGPPDLAPLRRKRETDREESGTS